MKLRTLAIAVAMASVATAAQADLTISGDVGAAYYSADEAINQFGSEVNFDASEKVGAVTFGGHLGLQYGEDGSASLNEGRVSAAGGFGTVILGHNDNGCNSVDIGGTNELILTHDQGGCAGESDGNIVYMRTVGPASMAISHNPAADQTTLGLAGTMGPVGISLGYETNIANPTTAAVAAECPTGTTASGDFCVNGTVVTAPAGGVTASGETDSNIVLGLTGAIGPVTVGFRANKLGDNDPVHGINAIYSSGNNSIYGGLGTSKDNDTKSFGYLRSMGMTDFLIEASDDGSDTEYAVGMRHRF